MYTPCTRSLFLQKNTHDSRPLLTRDQTVVPGHERYVKALLVQVLIRTLSFHPWFSGFNHIPLGRNCEHLVYRWWMARFWWEDGWAALALLCHIVSLVSAVMVPPHLGQ